MHAKAPKGLQDQDEVPASPGLLQAMPTLRGIITTQPVPLVVSWATGANGAQEGLTIDCSLPVAATLYTAPAGSFAAGTTGYTWEGNAHRGSTCQVVLPVSSGSGDITGTVKVCGAQVAAWSGAYSSGRSVPFTATAGACPAELA